MPVPHAAAVLLPRGVAARLTRAALLLLLAVAAAGALPATSHAAACTPPVVSAVACENDQNGSPASAWEVEGAGDPTIQGYATTMSVDKGETVSFKIKSSTSNYHIDIYRIGYYRGDGARLVESNIQPTSTAAQPACQTSSSTGLVDCGNWSVSASWTVPTTAVSGVYEAHLVRNDTGGDSQILFVVRDDASHSDVVVSTSDETWQAYNTYGGNSLYQCTVACPPGEPAAYKGAYKVSYNRPFHTAEDDQGRSWFFTGAEYPMVRFLEANGYDVSYVSSGDVASRGSLLLNHKLFISSGHDEYWSANQRANMEAARDAGVNLAFFTGNTGFWKTRWEPDAAGSANRTLVSYKDTHFDTPQDPVTWTGTWRDPRFTSPADGITPENALTGQSFLVNSGSSLIRVPYAYRQLRMWRNTAAANLTSGQSLSLGKSLSPTLGYEWDEDADNGFRPPGEIKLSSTTVSGLEVFSDYGSTTRTGATATHNLTLYKAPSGARVFNSGTVQWAWGLDNWNPSSTDPDRNMQQATVNLFADLGAQPATLQAGLVGASATTDSTPPTSTLTSPPATVQDGAKVTLTGTASDTGGVVAGVEVSTDGGSTWHPATGTTNWSYTWIAHGNPSTTIKWRATDDSGNTQTPGAGVTVDVSCPCSLWGSNVTPLNADSSDPTPVEVGVKFKTDTFGTVTGVRFYKATGNTGTHVGSLWSADGQRLAQATFQNESTTGWQTVTFDNPVPVQPNTTYIASYYAPNGHYSATPAYFYRAPAPGPNGGAVVDAEPLHAVTNSGTTLNGLFAYSASSTFPANSFGASNYWVDVSFVPTPPPGQVTDVTATAAGRTSATVSWSAPATGGTPTSYTITPYVGSTAQTPTTVTGTPPVTSKTIGGLTTGTTYTFRVQASNPNGSGAVSAPSNAVTPLTAVAPSAPTDVAAVPASQRARVTWTAPESDGDSAITGYTVTAYSGSTVQASVQAGAAARGATVNDLVNGTSYTFKVTATNGVGTGPSSSASAAVTPQATILDLGTPAMADSLDTHGVELGVKFKADYDGTITGLRFYKAAANAGPHVGTLWSATGTQLARVTFSNETASGWQTATFATPVDVTAGTTYVASYFAPSGHYSADGGGLQSAIDNGPLHAIASSSSANGVFAYSTSSTFPTGSYNATNYWVDVLYAVPQPGEVTNVTAAEAGRSSAVVSWSAPASGGPVTSYRITPYVGSTAQTATVITGTPPGTTKTIDGLTTGTTYTFTVQAVNANGAGAESAASNAVTPAAAVKPSAPTGVTAIPASERARVSWTAPSDGDSAITGYTVTPYAGSTAQSPVQVDGSSTSATVTGLTNGTKYTFKVSATNGVGTGPDSAASDPVTPQDTIFDFATPATVDAGEGNAVELGVKFTADSPGSITGIRFYKAAANTGTHVGSLWTAGGSRLAQATFTGESDSGWQTVTFANPVDVTVGTTYVASYYAPRGHYSVTGNAFASGAVDNPPLHALADATSSNGVFAYSGTPSTFPTSTYRAGNYWVDVLFQPAPAPGKVTGVTATAGQAAATVSWTAPSSGGTPTAYEITPFIGSDAQTPTTITGTPPATSKTITGLTPGTDYTFTVQASNPGGSGPASDPSNTVTPLGATAPAAPTDVSARAEVESARVSWTAPDDGGSAITGYTITPFAGSTAQDPVQAGASATSATVSGLTAGTSYTFEVTARNAVGAGPASAASGAVAPLAAIFDFRTPDIVDAGDGNSVQLGVKFRSDVGGQVVGIRFYKAAANTGTHIGTLWDAAGNRLAQATFSGEDASGWQTVRFDQPVTITSDTTYVAGYLAPNGHYSVTGAAFGSGGIDNGPLHALANATSPNGVYLYTGTPAFPTNTFNAGNYWVDVLFAPGAGQ